VQLTDRGVRKARVIFDLQRNARRDGRSQRVTSQRSVVHWETSPLLAVASFATDLERERGRGRERASL